MLNRREEPIYGVADGCESPYSNRHDHLDGEQVDESHEDKRCGQPIGAHSGAPCQVDQPATENAQRKAADKKKSGHEAINHMTNMDMRGRHGNL